MNNKVEDYLIKLGFSHIEAKIYHGLLKHGPTTVKQIADHVDLNRVTTHFQIGDMVKKGYVIQIRNKSRRQICAQPPSRLKDLIAQKEEELNIMKEKFPKMVREMSHGLYNHHSGDEVSIKYYEGLIAIRQVYEEILHADKIYSFVNVNKTSKAFPENASLFQKSIESNPRMEMWEIKEDSIATGNSHNLPNNRYHHIFIPANISLYSSDIIIFDDNVAMIYIDPDKPHAIVTNSSGIAAGIRGIHRTFWNLLSGKDY